MSINELHASHIGRVAVSFYLSSPSLNVAEATSAVGLRPDIIQTDGRFCGFSSKGKVEGELKAKDINEHIQFLLNMLLPYRDSILKFTEGGETSFDVLWESSYLYAGTGPEISRECLMGMSLFRASLGFDIYQIDDERQAEESLSSAEA